MPDALQYPFFVRALIAGLLCSVPCGIVGCYVVVKRIASISGGMSHAAFGGVGLGYLAGFDPGVGAAGFALLSGFGIGHAYRRLRSGLDTLIAMMWSVGMALGILFVSLTPGYAPDLMSYLFGSILFVPDRFLVAAAGLNVVVGLTVFLLFKEFQAISFDEEYTEARGIPFGPVFHTLLALISLTVVVLIRVVGVILVIALLTIPAAIARQWCDRLTSMMVIASTLCAACTTAGLFLAYWLSDTWGVSTPTGPLIILLAVALYGASSLARVPLRGSRNER
jgi:zinc transport system permease protein